MDAFPPSIRDKTPEVQLGALREYAARRGFELVAEFVDFASGARNGRPEYRRMFDAARKRRFDVLLVWRYDRFAPHVRDSLAYVPIPDAAAAQAMSRSGGKPSRKAPTLCRCALRPCCCWVTVWISRKRRSKSLPTKIAVAPARS